MIKYPQIKSIDKEYINLKLNEFLQEDSPNGDITSLFSIEPKTEGVSIMNAKEDLVFVGEQIIKNFFDDSFKIEFFCQDGDNVKKDEQICRIEGNIHEILRKERIFLNLVQRLSGIATITKKLVQLAEPYGVKVLDTRKTTPGLRVFERYAVSMAGGQNHRFNLSEGILIKDNHLSSSKLSIADLVKKIKLENKDNYPIQLEVDTLEQVKDGIIAKVDGFLLDNMTPDQCIEAVQLVKASKSSIFLEASGGINSDNLTGYLPTGIDAVSIGALTHSVKSADINLEFINN